MLLGSSILELAVGMIFFYFLLSTICSQITEVIAGLLDWRTEELLKGIRDLLNLPMAEGSPELPSDHPAQATVPAVQSPTTLGDRLMAHPLIQGLATKPYWLRSVVLRRSEHQPSYIPDRTFSLAIIDILANAQSATATSSLTTPPMLLDTVRSSLQKLPPQLQEALMPLVGGAAQDLDAARKNIESWFNAKMDRISGAYKRWTLFVLLLLAAAVSIIINADSIAVARTLWQSPTLRQVIATSATEQATTGAPQAPSSTSPADRYAQTLTQIREVQADVQNVLSFPIGWGATCTVNSTTNSPLGASTTGQAAVPMAGPSDAPNCTPQSNDVWGWLWKLLGLAATTVAVSLGAPFWFDLLNKVSQLRSSGPSPNDKDSAVASSQINR